MRATHYLVFEVPGQPVGKGRARIGRVAGQARMFTPDKTVRYENLVALAAKDGMYGGAPMEGPVSVNMEMSCQIPESWSKKKKADALRGALLPTTKPDVDNVVKAVFDAMNGIAWKDDTQCVSLSVVKLYSLTPGVKVSAWTYQPKEVANV